MSDSTPLEQMRPLHRGALRHDVVRRLLRAIFQRELPAGMRLVAKRLSDLLGVSATPIREALVTLEQVGVVELQHNRGAVVKPFGQKELRDIYHVRRVLESEAARCACGRFNRATLDACRRETQSLVAPTSADGAWLKLVLVSDRDFHTMIADHCDNPRLANEILRYDTLVQTTREMIGDRPAVHRQGMEQHLRVIEAFLAEKAGAAQEAMSAHLDIMGNLVAEIVFADK